MNSKSKFDLLIEAGVKSWGGSMSLFGIVAAVLAFFIIGTETKYEARWVVPFCFILIFLIIVSLRAFIIIHNDSFLIPPKVRIAHKPVGAFTEAYAILLTAPSPFFSQDSIVSVFILESEFERLIGIGKVINVQIDQQIQIAVIHDMGFEEKWESLYESRVADLGRLIIKPSMPHFVFQELYNGQ